jgi:hypothetical protein
MEKCWDVKDQQLATPNAILLNLQDYCRERRSSNFAPTSGLSQKLLFSPRGVKDYFEL